MPILLGLLTAIGIAAFFIIRANNAARAAHDLTNIAGEAAGEAKGIFRRALWRRRVENDPLKTNQDPVLAATIIMCAVAQSDSDLSQPEIETILDNLEHQMGLAAEHALSQLQIARSHVHGKMDTNTVIRRAMGPIMANCTDAERNELVEMLRTVAAAGDAPTASQNDAIDRLRTNMGLRKL